MKTTLDLPDDLVRQLKLRAVHDGRKLKDLAAELLRTGLISHDSLPPEKPATVIKDKKTGLPVIQGRRAAPKDQELTPQRVADILNAQEAGWARDAG